MQVVIVEDEINGFEYLSKILQQIDPSIVVVEHCESVKEAVNYFSKHPPVDLIFMDVQLADGISFDIFEHVDISTPVIFTTAYDEYAIQAFKVNSVDYLLKPILKEHLVQALDKFYNKLSDHKGANQSNKINQLLIQNTGTKSRCLVKRGNHFEYVNVSDIAFVNSEDSITFLFTGDGNRFIYNKTVEQFASELSTKYFFQISRSSIVNIKYISQIHPFHNQRLLVKLKSNLEKDLQLIVSRGRATEFKQWVDQ